MKITILLMIILLIWILISITRFGFNNDNNNRSRRRRRGVASREISRRTQKEIIYKRRAKNRRKALQRQNNKVLEKEQFKRHFNEDLLLSRELALNKFNAYQECPKCQKYSFALIEQICSPWDLERKCGNCEHKWLQRK